jgi:hypothetical protein
VVDALLWWNADQALIDLARPAEIDDDTWRSLLTRAWTFRLLAYDESSRAPSQQITSELDQYQTVLTHIGERFGKPLIGGGHV